MNNEKKLSLLIDPSQAVDGAGKIKKALGEAKNKADVLQKSLEGMSTTLNGIDAKKLKDLASTLTGSASVTNAAKTATEKLEKQLKDLVEIMWESNKATRDQIAILSDARKEQDKFTVAKNNSNEGYLKEYKNQQLVIRSLEQQKKGVRDQVDEQLGLNRVIDNFVKRLDTLSEIMDKSNTGLRARQASLKAIQAEETRGLRIKNQLKDSALVEWEANERNRLKLIELRREITARLEAEMNYNQKKTLAQKEEDNYNKKLEQSNIRLTQARNGQLETLLRAQKAEKEAVDAVKSHVNAETEQEKVTKALAKARQQLLDIKIREEARTKALTEANGLQSVRIQEQRRLTEELIRSKARLAAVNSPEYAELVRTRKAIEDKNKALRDADKAAESTRLSTSNLTSATSALTTAMSGLAVYFSVQGLVRTADEYTNLTNRLAAVTRGTVDVTQATRGLLDTAIDTRSSLDAVMDIYSKMIRINENLGKSQEEVANLTEAVSKAVSMSGASVQGAQGAIMQFAQAMSANWATSAQELNSILEQTPALAYYMVEGLKEVTGQTDLTAGTLKRFAEQGGLSAEIVFEAFQRVLPRIREDFENTQQTVGSSLQNLKDAFTVLIGEMDKTYNVTNTVAQSFKELAKDLPDMQAEIATLTAGITGFVAALSLIRLGAILTAIGPIGWAITGVSVAVGALAAAVVNYNATHEDMADTADKAREKMEGLARGAEKYKAAIDVSNSSTINDRINDLGKEFKRSADEVDRLTKKLEELQAKADEQKGSWWYQFFVPNFIRNDVVKEIKDTMLALDTEGLILGDTISKLGYDQQQFLKKSSEEASQAAVNFEMSVDKLAGSQSKVAKINEDYVKAINKLKEARMKADDEATKKESDGNARRALLLKNEQTMIRGVTAAQQVRQEALDKLNKKGDNNRRTIEQEIALLEAELVAVQAGTEAYLRFKDEKQAMNKLKIFDSQNAQVQEYADTLGKLRDVQTEVNATQIRMASEKSNEKEITAVLAGQEALKQFRVEQEAIQQLGLENVDLSLTKNSDLLALFNAQVASNLKLLNTIEDQAKAEMAGKTIEDLKEEIAARNEGEEAYQKLLIKRMALQAIGEVKEGGLTPEQKKNYEETVELLTEINRLQNVIKEGNPWENLSDSLSKSSDVFGDWANDLASVVDSIDELSKAQENYSKGLINSNQLQRTQLQGYGDMAGSAKSFFKEGSKGYEALQKAQMVFRAAELAMSIKATAQALVEGQAKASAGVANQAGGDPYTAFVRIAAMAAIMASLGFNTGASSANISADRQATQGTGTVLGDTEAKSESIMNAVEYSADALDDLIGINGGMLAELRSLNRAISGGANIIARDIDYSNFNPMLGLTGTARSLDNALNSYTNTINSVLDKAGFVGSIMSVGTNGFNKLFSEVLGGVFGKTSVSDQGIQIVGGRIDDIINNTTAQAYQTVKKKSWFSSSTSENILAVSDSVERQFDLIFQSLFKTVETGASGLGFNQNEIQQRLNSFVVDSFKISLKDLDPEEQATELNAVFSKTFDQLAEYVLPILTEFQNAGEGAGETLSRVSTNFQVFNEGIRQLDLQKLEGAPDTLLRISESFISLFESAGDAVSAYTGFVDTFATDERKFEILSESLTNALGEQDVAILKSRDGVYDYIKAVQESGENEAERIANILSMTDALDGYFDLLESVNEAAIDLAESGVDEAFRKLQESIQAERDSLNETYQKNLKEINDKIAISQDVIQGLEGVISSLENGVKSLRAESYQLDLARYTSSRNALTRMSQNYLATGILPDTDNLDNVLDNITGDNRQFYSDYTSYIKAQAQDSQKLRDMAELAEDQLTVEERMLNSLRSQAENLEKIYNNDLRSLDETLKMWQDQLNILDGIDITLKDIPTAIAELATAIANLELARKEAEVVGTGSGSSFSNSEVKATADYIYSKNITNGVMNWDAAEKEIALTAAANGVTAQQLANSLGTTVENVNNVAGRLGVPLLQEPVDGSHANGLDNVPFDGYRAELHKGEMVLTQPVANAVRGMASGGNQEVVSLLRDLISIIRQDSFNTNKKLVRLVDLHNIVDKWDVQGMPNNRGY